MKTSPVVLEGYFKSNIVKLPLNNSKLPSSYLLSLEKYRESEKTANKIDQNLLNR